MKKFIKGIKLFLKMKFEMFIWRLYDKCADYLDKHSLVIRVDSDKLQELEDKYWKLVDDRLDKDREIMDLEEENYYLKSLLERYEEA